MTLFFLNKFVYNLNALVERNSQQSMSVKMPSNNNAYNTNIQEENESVIINNNSTSNTLALNSNNIEESSTSSSNLIDVKDKITKNLHIKKLLEKAIEIFNIGKSSSECLKFLQKEKMLFTEPTFTKNKVNLYR